MSSVVVNFAKDGVFRMEYRDSQGKPGSLNGDYEADFTKTPIPLSIRNIPQLPHPLHTIIQYEGPDVLRVGRFAPRWRLRPIGFELDAEILLVRRPEANSESP